MKETMEQIAIGYRVRVIDSGLPQYGQLGTVIAASTGASWYVNLDESVNDQTFFQAEELAIVAVMGRVQPSARFQRDTERSTPYAETEIV